jgi:hypothetical protein
MGKKEMEEKPVADGVYEDSECPYHDEPAQNAFEKAKWNSDGYDQSGMRMNGK